MVLLGGEVHRYPVTDNVNEKTLNSDELVGGICVTPEDHRAREKYILELESFAEGK